MAKARSRTAARKIKDKWKAKGWYNILAPPSFDSITLADTLADNPGNLINRVTAVFLQDLTNDFRKSHIKLFFKIHKVEETDAHTQFVGHTLTSDYLRRMVRRRRSKIDGVYDVSTRDGAVIRVKPFATTDRRVQNSQKKVVREAMKKTLTDQGKNNTLSEYIRNILDGKIGSDIYKNCKKLYPVKRIEIHKTEVISQPTIEIKEKKPTKKEEKEEPAVPDKKEKTRDKEKEKPEETEEKPVEVEEKPEEKPKGTEASKKKGKKSKAKKPAVKKTTKKTTKTTKVKTAAKKKANSKKKTTKKK